jgi:predicted nucleotidyltransferase
MDLSLPVDFREFLRLLIAHGVRFLLVGGYAVVYHGHWRTTEDLDVWIAVDRENAEKVVAALREFGFDIQGLAVESFMREHQIVRLGIAPMQIEIHTSITGGNFDECHARSVSVNIEGERVPVISLNDLRAVKAAAARPKDLADVARLKK